MPARPVRLPVLVLQCVSSAAEGRAQTLPAQPAACSGGSSSCAQARHRRHCVRGGGVASGGATLFWVRRRGGSSTGRMMGKREICRGGLDCPTATVDGEPRQLRRWGRRADGVHRICRRELDRSIGHCRRGARGMMAGIARGGARWDVARTRRRVTLVVPVGVFHSWRHLRRLRSPGPEGLCAPTHGLVLVDGTRDSRVTVRRDPAPSGRADHRPCCRCCGSASSL